MDLGQAIVCATGIASVAVTLIVTMIKYGPSSTQRHVVETKPGESCATREQMEAVAKELIIAFKEHTTYVHTRFHDHSQLAQTGNNRLFLLLHLLKIKWGIDTDDGE